jgi:hypothetical protein
MILNAVMLMETQCAITFEASPASAGARRRLK